MKTKNTIQGASSPQTPTLYDKPERRKITVHRTRPEPSSTETIQARIQALEYLIKKRERKN